MTHVTESDLEKAALSWFAELGYEIPDSDNLDPDSDSQERESYEQVILLGRLREALDLLNPDGPVEAIEEALRRLQRFEAPTLIQRNMAFHKMLTDGLEIEVPAPGGKVKGVHVRLFDFDAPEENDWLVVNQFSVVDRATGTGKDRRPDIVVYVNGIPLAVVELKGPEASQNVWDAYTQLQNYKRDIPSLFATNEVLVISDEPNAFIGSLTATDSRFSPWRTIDGNGDAPRTEPPLKVLIHGLFHKQRFLDYLRSFVTFESDGEKVEKKIAGYHQFHLVRKAVHETVRATGKKGDHRIGVVWHTQGSGKSLSMVFYAGKLVLEPAMENPTILIVTDRNDLDNQLFGTFSMSKELLRQTAVQAQDRKHLQKLLETNAQGGIIFTTVQLFLPEEGKAYPKLSDRSNIVVIADEAHRSQYGFKSKVNKKGELVYGYAKYMRDALPSASFIGFTGTPIDETDKSTPQVFGKYIDVYDIKRAVEDKATVPIYFESRLAKIELDEKEKPKIDPQFEEVTEGEEIERKEALKSTWATLAALVGTDKRLKLVARDLVEHFEKRQETIRGKALIVCMSRQICADIYKEVTKIRPAWHDADQKKGRIKVVMTGSASDPESMQPHFLTAGGRDLMAKRFKDPNDELEIVIVRDMWLTGFDAPCMHTLYVDKPMQGANLMQAIARVNRVFKDKPGGLVVDYLGISPYLKKAMKTYTASAGDDRGELAERQENAVEAMKANLETCRTIFKGFDYSKFFTGSPMDRLAILPGAREHILKLRQAKNPDDKKAPPDGYDRFKATVGNLTKAFALAMPHDECEKVRDEVAFFQAVKVGLEKLSAGKRGAGFDAAHAVRQIVSNAVVSDEVMDVFSAAGLPRPDISILSDEFLLEVQGMENRNLAAELLQKLLSDAVKSRSLGSVIQAKKFSELLEKAVKQYRNRAVEAAQVIEELITLAKDIRKANERGEALKLNTEEFAFYEALADHEEAVREMGDETLSKIAKELTEVVRKSASIDWNLRSSVQARMRVEIRRLLRRYKYPPGEPTEKATNTVLEQAKLLGINIVEGGSEAPGAPGTWTDDTTPAAEKPLPYPIAVFDGLVGAESNTALRVKQRFNGIEKALTFLVGAQLALLREQAKGDWSPEVRKVLGGVGKPVSFGTWLDYAWQLGALLPDGADPVVRASKAFVTPDGKPTALVKDLQGWVSQRNDLAHGVITSEEAHAKMEVPLAELWLRLKQALAPFAEARLVSLEKLTKFAGEGQFGYSLRLLHGSDDKFKVIEEVLPAQLAEEWCYLLRGNAPLALTPVVLCRKGTGMPRHEVWLARQLGIEEGAKVEVVAVASEAKVKVAV